MSMTTCAQSVRHLRPFLRSEKKSIFLSPCCSHFANGRISNDATCFRSMTQNAHSEFQIHTHLSLLNLQTHFIEEKD